MIRIAAVGDLHFGPDSAGSLRPNLAHLPERADVLLLAGDLTRCGDPKEATVIAGELEEVPVPKVAVLGNHDYHSEAEEEVSKRLEAGGVEVLEGTSTTVDIDGMRVGIAGVKGFGGGFAGASGTDFGELEMKAFISHTQASAQQLREALVDLACDVRVALTHYSPVEDTLRGERLEIYPFLGSYLLAQAIDDSEVTLAIHGHAHQGREKGITPGGVRVRNVAYPVIQSPYRVYALDRPVEPNVEA